MKRDRQSRLVAILALCVSVVGLTLGFAAFSNTLTISSSATVSPNSSDFNIGVYGLQYEGTVENNWDFDLYSTEESKTASKPILYSSEVASQAKISDDGESITISDISVEMTAPGQGVEYYFMIKNDGEYDAYFDFYAINQSIGKTCTPGTGATATLVEGACESVSYDVISTVLEKQSNGEYWDITTDALNAGYFPLTKDRYIFLGLYISYGDVYADATNDDVVRADGPFTVKFEDITLDFSTVNPSES